VVEQTGILERDAAPTKEAHSKTEAALLAFVFRDVRQPLKLVCQNCPTLNMIARRRWFRCWAPHITQRGYVCTRRAKVQTKTPSGCVPDGAPEAGVFSK